MAGAFDYFVVLAGMRTGSNLLEEQLAAMPGVECYGELFNPHFFGKPDTRQLWGTSLDERDENPVKVIQRMRRAAKGIPGFRLFHDHDKRVIDHVLADRRAAKLILTRRPLDSYVSLKIAKKTDQWWLSDMATARAARVAFEVEEYVSFLNDLHGFQNRIRQALQTTGQTAFHIGYEDLSNEDVLSGLGAFIGAKGAPDTAKVRAKVQNPSPVEDRLTNAEEAEAAIAKLGAPDLGRIASYEPSRGPGLKFFNVGQTVPLIYMPIRGAWDDPIPDWMRAMDPKGQTETGFTQKDLRRWKRQHPGHRSFTVLRHPLLRAHDAFCRYLLPLGLDGYSDIRALLITRYDVPLPLAGPDGAYGLDQHRDAFLAFLKFLLGNLGGQTSVRVDNSWASQYSMIEALGSFVVPDRIIRSNRLAADLNNLAEEIGYPGLPTRPDTGVSAPYALSDIVNSEIEQACEAAFRRDYIMFGFGDWAPAD